MSHAKQFDDALNGSAGSPIDITAWFQYFRFDVMGELRISQSDQDSQTKF